MNFIRINLLAIFTLLSTASAADPMQDHLDFACDVMEVDCSGLPVPQVVMIIDPFIGGSHDTATPEVIYMNGLIDNEVEFEGILTHEISHYVDYWINGNTESSKEADCRSEEIAFAVSDAWWMEKGYPELVIGDLWKEKYGCSVN